MGYLIAIVAMGVVGPVVRVLQLAMRIHKTASRMIFALGSTTPVVVLGVPCSVASLSSPLANITTVMPTVVQHIMLPSTTQHSEWPQAVEEPIRAILLQRLVFNLSAPSISKETLPITTSTMHT